MVFLVTTSPCRDWVICAPAAFLGSGSRFSALSPITFDELSDLQLSMPLRHFLCRLALSSQGGLYLKPSID